VPNEAFIKKATDKILDKIKANDLPKFLDLDSNKRPTPHGFRSSFKQWAAEQTEFEDVLSEIALAHVDKNAVRAAYRRNTKMIEKRRPLMEDWANWCAQ
jgi:integrase